MSTEIFGIVYKATNLSNGKVYIGQTIRKLAERKNRHIRDAINGGTKVFCKALRKYGVENFQWDIIDTAHSSSELDSKEIYWIKYYNSYVNKSDSNGYNMKIGGEGLRGEQSSPKFTNKEMIEIFEIARDENLSIKNIESRFDLSKSQINNIVNLDTGWSSILINHFGEKGLYDIIQNIRKRGTEEASIKLSQLKSKENHHMWNKKGKDNPNSKAVIQLDLESEKIIREFSSAVEAGKFVGSPDGSKIGMVCRGKRNKAYGYKWMFASEYYKKEL